MLGRFKRQRADTATKRHGAAEGSPRWPLEVWQRDDPRADGPDYVGLCLSPAFREEPEARSLRDGDGMGRIIEVAKTGGMETPAMARVVEELLADPRYAALDTLYSWLAPVYRDTDRQLEVIEHGLRTCPRKYKLLELAGTAMLQRERGAAALYYWAQSVVNAESLGEGPDASAYDFLIVVAHVAGQRGAVKAFRARTGEADHPEIVLDEEYTELVETAFRKPSKETKAVIQALAARISA
ncbi:hypothetical protein BAY61_10875 [Prauserella marina]|uniref:Uncharacterized protein n=1 Tax=Prauserella marina TaxID=530584 RepID=A0A222VNC7_9PSEU|nr:hypothetical protein [Prauserella marina]ASR35418.1 hypothetical protein BAY61_10875 [Prauserella marina]PWV84776.1 hypothetical protein DES30_101794 [Prauserella marina]SDC13461.1 hypothetical protein SAMN05421630_101542 [Prauserella marina]